MNNSKNCTEYIYCFECGVWREMSYLGNQAFFKMIG